MYDEIKSNYIKKKIKGMRWNEKNRKYINDLMCLERLALGRIGGMADSYYLHNLKDKHKKEYEAILEDLKPGELERIRKRELKEKEKEEREHQRFLEQERKEEINAKKRWLKMGGKL